MRKSRSPSREEMTGMLPLEGGVFYLQAPGSNGIETRKQAVFAQASWYLKDLECLLIDLGFLQKTIREEMEALALEYRRVARKGRLILYVKRRSQEGLPTALYWGELFKVPKVPSEIRIPFPPAKDKHRIRHIAGGLADKLIFEVAKDIGRKALHWEFDRRALELNAAYHPVIQVTRAVESSLRARGDRRAWEAGDLATPAPTVSSHLSPESQDALGCGWFLFLRMASVEVDLMSLADQYNADPVHRAFRMAFDRDPGHPYGHSRWVHNGRQVPSRSKTKRSPDDLTDRDLRDLGIPESDRRSLCRIEQDRRRLSRIHDRYKRVIGKHKRTGGQAKAEADKRLLASRPREGVAS